MCVKVTQVVNVECDAINHKECNACAIAMAQIYQEYENYVNDLYKQIFLEYETKMFNILEG